MGLAKDDVTPQDIFRLTKEGPNEKGIIVKYCIQDCNLVHHIFVKIDVMTSFVEMSKICSVPISLAVARELNSHHILVRNVEKRTH